MRLFYQPSPQNSLVRGILTIIVGILLLTLPGLTLKSVIMTIGAMILFSGIFSALFPYLRKKQGRKPTSSFQGFFNILLGILFLASPMAIVNFFGFFFGMIFFLMGLMQFFGALATLSKSFWSWIYLIFAILMTSAGLFLLIKPIESAENILAFFGAVLLFYGILEVMNTWRLKKMPPRSNSNNIVDTTYEEV
jgi:uncharacterized membrane protein HdeD (DUF308 family)